MAEKKRAAIVEVNNPLSLWRETVVRQGLEQAARELGTTPAKVVEEALLRHLRYLAKRRVARERRRAARTK